MQGEAAVPDRLFKYATPQGAIGILETMSLWCRSPLYFDDPYDSQIAPRMGCTVEQIVEVMHDASWRLLSGDEPLNPAMRPELSAAIARFRPMMRGVSREEFVRAMGAELTQWGPAIRAALADADAQWQDFMRSTRVLSLTADSRNALMWALYAQRHEGVNRPGSAGGWVS